MHICIPKTHVNSPLCTSFLSPSLSPFILPFLTSCLRFLQASGEAVISRLPDQAEARQASLQDATSVYDLLAIGLARRGQYAMLSEVKPCKHVIVLGSVVL